MKKLFSLLGASVFYGSGLFAQAYIGQEDKSKTPQAAAAIRLSFKTDQVESALKAYLSNKGYSATSSHGFIVYRGVLLDSTDKTGSDLYFITASADRKVKDMTILSLVPARRNQDIGSGSFADSSKLDAAKTFLDSLAPFAQTYGTTVEINNQQDALNKAQKKLNDLLNDKEDLNKRLRKLQGDLDQNKTDQVKAAADLQSSVNSDDESKKKNQKRLSKLIDEQGSLEKRIRRTNGDLDDNKTDQQKQQALITQQQQGLDATKARLN
jgi:hypothetical protein